jgi:hypothetical protein
MQSVDVTTQVEGQPPEAFTLTRAHGFAPWCLLGQEWVLYQIYPGCSYSLSHGYRTVTVSDVY